MYGRLAHTRAAAAEALEAGYSGNNKIAIQSGGISRLQNVMDSSGTSSVPDASSSWGLIFNGIMQLRFDRLSGVVRRPSPDRYDITLDTLHFPLQVAYLCALWLG